MLAVKKRNCLIHSHHRAHGFDTLGLWRQKFTQKGFDGVGVREIADTAGVNVALISRYFGSKKQLFIASILSRLSIEPMLAEAREDWPETIATFLLDKSRQPDGIDPLLAVLRAAGSPSITPAIKQIFEEKILNRLAGELPPPMAGEQAALLISLLFGLDTLRRIFNLAPLSTGDTRQLHAHLAQAIRQLLTLEMPRIIQAEIKKGSI
jgi:AcrR family transcriptional regulator